MDLQFDQPEIALAHPGKRFQAQFIDGLISYFLGYSTFFLLAFVLNSEISGYSGLAIALIYFLFSDSLPNGQSIGKKLLGIRVVSNDSKRRSCNPFQSFLRNITFPLSIFDWIFIFFGDHQRLGDMIAHTIVIKK